MIWFREINEALLNRFKNLVEDLKDYYGNDVDVKVLIRNPDEEIVDEHYPCVTLIQTRTSEELGRSDVNSFDIEEISPTELSVTGKPSIFSFSYQLDVWCKSPIERDAITGRLMSKLPKHSVLYVKDGEDEHPCPLTIDPLDTKDFRNSNNEIIYRNVAQFNVYAPVHNKETTIHTKVGNIGVQQKPK